MAVLAPAPPDSDAERRHLLTTADDLLDEVEVLRLGDETAIPDQLCSAIQALQQRIGRATGAPRTLQAAHDLLLTVEQRLMAANPRHATTRTHPGRGSGQFVTKQLPAQASWKLLALPPLPPQGWDSGWLELVEETVERACDRWAWAQHLAVTAARDRRDASAALARARAAWENYWELRQEAAGLRLRKLRPLPA